MDAEKLAEKLAAILHNAIPTDVVMSEWGSSAYVADALYLRFEHAPEAIRRIFVDAARQIIERLDEESR